MPQCASVSVHGIIFYPIGFDGLDVLYSVKGFLVAFFKKLLQKMPGRIDFHIDTVGNPGLKKAQQNGGDCDGPVGFCPKNQYCRQKNRGIRDDFLQNPPGTPDDCVHVLGHQCCDFPHIPAMLLGLIAGLANDLLIQRCLNLCGITVAAFPHSVTHHRG